MISSLNNVTAINGKLVATGLEMLRYLNNKFPCRENSLTITKLEEALMWNDQGTKNRQARGVEGKNEL